MKITFETDNKEVLSKEFDEDIERFSQYMSNLPDWKVAGALADWEKALVKSYLVFKHKESTNGTQEGSPDNLRQV